MRRNGVVPLAGYPAVDLASDRRPPCGPDHSAGWRDPVLGQGLDGRGEAPVGTRAYNQTLLIWLL